MRRTDVSRMWPTWTEVRPFLAFPVAPPVLDLDDGEARCCLCARPAAPSNLEALERWFIKHDPDLGYLRALTNQDVMIISGREGASIDPPVNLAALYPRIAGETAIDSRLPIPSDVLQVLDFPISTQAVLGQCFFMLCGRCDSEVPLEETSRTLGRLYRAHVFEGSREVAEAQLSSSGFQELLGRIDAAVYELIETRRSAASR